MAKKEVNYWMDEIDAHLMSWCENLHPCIYLPHDGTAATLIISAGGNFNYFNKVEELVFEAPQIAGWEIIAFYPPRPIDYDIEEKYGHTGIDPHNLWFMPFLQNDGNPPHICVFAEKCEEGDQEFEDAVEAVITNLLGERSANVDLLGVTVDNLTDYIPEERAELIRLQELPAYLEKVSLSSYFINERGEMELKSGI